MKCAKNNENERVSSTRSCDSEESNEPREEKDVEKSKRVSRRRLSAPPVNIPGVLKRLHPADSETNVTSQPTSLGIGT